MQNKFFYAVLGISLLVHLILLGILSTIKLKNVKKMSKPIEVNYQNIKTVEKNLPRPDYKQVKIIKEAKLPKNIELLTKVSGKSDHFQEEVEDVSKFSKTILLDKKQTPKINMLDSQRKISVPLLQSEKITNPRYLSYNLMIRQKIEQEADRYVDEPEFKPGYVYLTFALDSRGILKDIKIIEEKTQASAYLKKIGLRSVKDSAPFPPFPKDLNFPELTFNVIISFEVKSGH